jgi:hypothetical protein
MKCNTLKTFSFALILGITPCNYVLAQEASPTPEASPTAVPVVGLMTLDEVTGAIEKACPCDGTSTMLPGKCISMLSKFRKSVAELSFFGLISSDDKIELIDVLKDQKKLCQIEKREKKKKHEDDDDDDNDDKKEHGGHGRH